MQRAVIMTLYLIAIAAGIALISVASVFYQQYQRHQFQLAKIADLQNQLLILTAGTVGVDERILKFERTLAKLKEQQSSQSLGTAPQHNYDHAIRLAKKGAAIEQLIDSCNLTDEEAHIIERMYGSGDESSSLKSDLH